MLESEEERSVRHARLIRTGLIFWFCLGFMMTAIAVGLRGLSDANANVQLNDLFQLALLHFSIWGILVFVVVRRRW